ncbi:hypothetical protein BRADI_4g22120v3 [Brachypodium distachyon]|uniref:DNA-directed RNA polymerases I and III subunit RPAC2 n=2 Tax=Brachypodium distachyon TaxID=15368 RepID=A0A0Q3EN44_BRADI|nr:hypothetical protein BRADI_4g22120v3 [Brachypodium distachyon]
MHAPPPALLTTVLVSWSLPRERESPSRPCRFAGKRAMEHGSLADSSASSFSIVEEDHTLANSVRFVLNQDPRVAFCGYSIPHPADNKVNIRVQTTGDPAKDVMKDALQDLMVMGQHVRATFDKAVADFKSNIPAEQMDVDANK